MQELVYYLNVITAEISFGCFDCTLHLLTAASVELLFINICGVFIRMACCSYWPFMERMEESRC